MGTTSISVEVGDTTFICVIVIFEVTNSISGKVGTLTLIEYLYIRIRFRITNTSVEVGMLTCIECMCLSSRKYHYLSGFRDTDLW